MFTCFKALVPCLPALLLPCTVAFTSSDALSRLVAYPDCAQSCIISAIQGGICGFEDQTCICGNEQFTTNITSCVGVRCTIPESLAVMNISRTSCGAPIRDRSMELKVSTITVGTVAALFVVLRFGYKLLIANLALAMDDWLTLVSMIFLVPSLVITTHGTIPNGLGKDIWTLDPGQITDAVKFFLITAVLYFALSMLVKLAFISFYLKVFPSRIVQRILWTTFAVTALWGVAFVLLAIFQCHPISYFWQNWDGLHDGTCLNANTIGWANASSGIALDLWILAIPLLQLRKLQLHWKRKIGVTLMFLVGAFVTIISVLRLKSLVNFAMSSNATWEYFDVTMWSIIEMSVGIMCACLPTIRLLLVRVFPALGESQQRTLSQVDYRYGSGLRSGQQSGVGTVVQVVGASKLGRNRSTKEGLSGIVLQKGYSVNYTEMEEEGSVALIDIEYSKDGRAMARE